MNVDNISKLNQMARDMLKHGLASSMDEAIKKAQQMTNSQTLADSQSVDVQGSGDTLAVSPTQDEPTAENPFPSENETAPEPAMETDTEPVAKEPAEEVQESQSEEQVDSMMEEDFKKLQTKVDEQQQMLDTLVSKFNEMIKEFNTLTDSVKAMAAVPTPAPEVEPPIVEPEAPAVSEPVPAQEEPKPEEGGTPRSGNYNSDDVAIDKIFYSGPKK